MVAWNERIGTEVFKYYPSGCGEDEVSPWICECGQFGEGMVNFDVHTSGCPTMIVKAQELDKVCPLCAGTGLLMHGDFKGFPCGCDIGKAKRYVC